MVERKIRKKKERETERQKDRKTERKKSHTWSGRVGDEEALLLSVESKNRKNSSLLKNISSSNA